MSVMGASKALEELAKLMPSEAHGILSTGSTEDVPSVFMSLSTVIVAVNARFLKVEK